jgi:putative endonuclease
MADSGYIYILRSDSSDRYYIGSCLDPARRLGEHVGGHVTATAHKGPWHRVALLEFSTPKFARQAEYWLKKLKRREYTAMIIAGSFRWPERFGAVALIEPSDD